MQFKEHGENSNLIKRLENMVRIGRISHAYIFEGPSASDKKALAEHFIKGILCPEQRGRHCGKCSICSKVDHQNHEDIMYISAEGGTVKDAAIIRMQERLKTKPFGEQHIVIVEDSDTMTRRAQNRLLKTLEEPPGKAVIILLSENMEHLLPTVLSRCVKYRINAFGTGEHDVLIGQASAIADMALNRAPFYQMKKAVENAAGNREETLLLLDALQTVYRNILVNREKGLSLYRDEVLFENIRCIETARKQIKDGISSSFAIKDLLLKIGG